MTGESKKDKKGLGANNLTFKNNMESKDSIQYSSKEFL